MITSMTMMASANRRHAGTGLARCLGLTVVLIAGCCPTSMLSMPQPRSGLQAAQSSVVRVGIGAADITPPVGLSLFGHGPESRVAIGTQLRLRCRAFVIAGAKAADGKSEAVALVPCDLSAPSLLLQREIAQRAQEKIAKADNLTPEQRLRLGAERVVLMATHTHMAPGHYFGVENYVGPFSSRLPGFDPKVLDFIADRVSDAIVEACRDLQPARIGWSVAPVTRTLTRNRSLTPFLRNKSLPDWLVQRAHQLPDHPAEAAVDPTLAVLRVDRLGADGGAIPAGVFAIFGMHPTALPNTNTFYSGDVFGYATRAVESLLDAQPSATRQHVLVGIANGIEGDAMPARATTGLREARRLGDALAGEIFEAWKKIDGFDTGATVRVAYRELALSDAQVGDAGEKPGRKLCHRPELGTPAGGGASDHPTMLRFFPQYNPGVRASQLRECQGDKLPIQMPTGEAQAGIHFPGIAPVSVITVGNHALVTMPAEVTTVTGSRVHDEVVAELSAKPEEVSVVGLTNEYLQYVATADEYPLQHYEGASTLYGPASAEFLREQAGCLARWLAKGSGGDSACRHGQAREVGEVGDVRYSATLPKVALLSAKPEAAARPQPLSSLPLRITDDGLLEYSVTFAGPDPRSVRSRADLCVHVYATDAQGSDKTPDEKCDSAPAGATTIDDDRGSNIVTAYDFETRTWKASWIPELAKLRQGAGYCDRFFVMVVRGASGKSQPSQPFMVECKMLGAASGAWP